MVLGSYIDRDHKFLVISNSHKIMWLFPMAIIFVPSINAIGSGNGKFLYIVKINSDADVSENQIHSVRCLQINSEPVATV